MQYWKRVAALELGRKKGFETPEILWKACCEYFEYIDNHPLIEEKVAFYEGDPSYADVRKMRPYTFKGLCIFLNVNEKTFIHYRKYPEFVEVCEMIDNVIYTQKFEGGMAGFFNATLVSRDLGLIEKQEIKSQHSVDDDQAAQFTDMLARLAERVKTE